MQRDPSRRSVKSFKWSRIFEEKLVRVAEDPNEKEEPPSEKTSDESLALKNESSAAVGKKPTGIGRAKSGAPGRLGVFVQDYMR